jgi:pyruvate-ferredoxin/flavodoxin oxidoreductase
MWSESLDGLKMNWAIFDFALTRPYFDLHEKNEPNSGGLFSITINPTTCKGCMECVNVCDDGALKVVPQTEDSVSSMRKNNGIYGWTFLIHQKNTIVLIVLKRKSDHWKQSC